jgi:hypothetical protein
MLEKVEEKETLGCRSCAEASFASVTALHTGSESEVLVPKLKVVPKLKELRRGKRMKGSSRRNEEPPKYYAKDKINGCTR